MINRMVEECDFATVPLDVAEQIEKLPTGDVNAVAKLITLAELHVDKRNEAAATVEQVLDQVKSLERSDSGSWNHRYRRCRKKFIDG